MMSVRLIKRVLSRRLSVMSMKRNEDKNTLAETHMNEGGDIYSRMPSSLMQENTAVGTKGESQATMLAKQQPPTWEFTENWNPPQQDSIDKPVNIVPKPHRHVLRTSLRKHRVRVLSPDHLEKKASEQQKFSESDSHDSSKEFQTHSAAPSNHQFSYPEPLKAPITHIKKKPVLCPYLNQKETKSAMPLQDSTNLQSDRPLQSNEWQQKTISLYQKMSLDALQAMRRAVAEQQSQPQRAIVENTEPAEPVAKPVETKPNVIVNEKVELKEKLPEQPINEPMVEPESESEVIKRWSWIDKRKCRTLAVDQVQSLDYNRRLWSSINKELQAIDMKPFVIPKKEPGKFRNAPTSTADQMFQSYRQMGAKPLDQKSDLKVETREAKSNETATNYKAPASSYNRATEAPVEVSLKSQEVNNDGDINDIESDKETKYTMQHFTVHPRERYACFNPQEYYTPKGKIYNRMVKGRAPQKIKFDFSNPIWDLPKDIWTDIRSHESDQPAVKAKPQAAPEKVEEAPSRITRLAALTARGPIQRDMRA